MKESETWSRESQISISRANYMVHSPLLGLGKNSFFCSRLSHFLLLTSVPLLILLILDGGKVTGHHSD